MAMHPVGEFPASTYWRRRGVLALGVLVVLLLLKSCVGGGGSARPAALPTSPSPVPSRKAVTVPARPSATPSRALSASPTASPTGTGTCPDASLSLVSTTDQPSYAVGSSPSLTLVVRNSGPVSCRRDLGSRAVELRVLSGTDRIWSSDDCSTGRGSDVRTLSPGASRSVRLTWSGKRSQPGCAGDRARARAGTYTLVARVGSLRRAGATFTLR